MYNKRILNIIENKYLFGIKNKFFIFSKIQKKNNYIFNSYKNTKKKYLTNLCLHQNKFKTICNINKMNRHELLFKLTFNKNKEFTKY